ncbi:MAG: RluA family pseudouridine synthase [Phycisphaerales bacterium]
MTDCSDDHVSLLGRGGKVDQQRLFDLYEQQSELDEEAPLSVRFVLARDLNKRLDQYLVDRIPFLSRTSLQRLVRERAVTVNGRPPKPSTRLRKGDEVVAVLPPPPSTEIAAEDIPLDVIFEDDYIIVLNKQADILVHPARSHQSGTLINGLAYHFQHRTSGELSRVGEEFARPGVVHRLDRFTSGVMVAAKTETAHYRLCRQFEQRTTRKRYLAIVHGRPEPLADEIDLPIGKHMTIRERYQVRFDETAKSALTLYHTRELFETFALVEVEIRTGRTHQIRVHLSNAGYPIAGDDMYSGRHVSLADVTGSNSLADREHFVLTRQALHAAMLGFEHPITGQAMTFHAPLKPDMQALIELLRKHQSRETLRLPGAVLDLDM